MTWSVVQSASAYFFGTTVTATFGSNAGSGNKIIAVVASSWSTAPSTVQDVALNNWTLLASKATTTGSVWLYALDVPAGDVGIQPAIKVTWSNSNAQTLLIQEVSGLAAGNTTAMIDGTAGTLSGTTAATGSPTYSSTAAGEYLVCAYGNANGTPTLATVDGTWTLDPNSQPGGSEASLEYKNSTNGSETGGFTGAYTGGWALAMAAFKLAAAGGGGASPQVLPYAGGQVYRRQVARRRQTMPVPAATTGGVNVTPAILTVSTTTPAPAVSPGPATLAVSTTTPAPAVSPGPAKLTVSTSAPAPAVSPGPATLAVSTAVPAPAVSPGPATLAVSASINTPSVTAPDANITTTALNGSVSFPSAVIAVQTNVALASTTLFTWKANNNYSSTTTTVTSFTLPLPTLAVNNILIATGYIDGSSNGTWSESTGTWQFLTSGDQNTSSTDPFVSFCAFKTASASELAPVFTYSGAAGRVNATVDAFSDSVAYTPYISASNIQIGTSSGTSFTPASLTAAHTGDVSVVSYALLAAAENATAITDTPSTGYTGHRKAQAGSVGTAYSGLAGTTYLLGQSGVVSPGAVGSNVAVFGNLYTLLLQPSPGPFNGTAVFPAPAVTTETDAPITTIDFDSPVSFPAPAVSTAGNVNVTTTVLSGSVSFPAPAITVASNASITTAILNGSVTLTAPTITGASNANITTIVLIGSIAIISVVEADEIVTTSVLATGVTFPAPTISTAGNASVTATVLSSSASFPAPAVSPGPATLAIGTSFPAPTVVTSPFPATLAISTARPAPAVSPGPATLAASATAPAPAVSPGPATLAVSTAQPAPAVSPGPATLAVSTAQPAPAVSPGPAVLAVSTAAPAPAVSPGPAKLAVSTAQPAPAVSPGPATLAVSTAAPAVTVTSNASITTVILNGSVSFTAPTVSTAGNVNVTTTVLSGSVSFPGPVITAASNAAITTSALATPVTFPAPAVNISIVITTMAFAPLPTISTVWGQSAESFSLTSFTGTLATEFNMPANKSLAGIWVYSPAGTTALPASCAIYNMDGSAVVPGTLNSSPSWSGAAGSGWVECTYTGPVLNAGTNYAVAVFYNGATVPQYSAFSWPDNTGAIDATASYYTLGGSSVALPVSNGSAHSYWIDVAVSAPAFPAAAPGAGTGIVTTGFSGSVSFPAPALNAGPHPATLAVTAAFPAANVSPGPATLAISAAFPAPVVSGSGGGPNPVTLAVTTAVSPAIVQQSYRLMDGASGRPGVGSSGTRPPASVTGLTGPYVAGTCFKVTTACWLQGYWWWVAPTVQETAAQKFCLWSANIDGSAGARGSVISAATITSGTLTAGAFNYIPLATPVPLAVGWTYMATTGWSPATGIPYTGAQFGAGDPYSAGITNGPLVGFSGQGGSNPDPFLNIQSAYNRVTADPAVTFPNTNSSDFNGWIDVQVTNTPPAGATYRLFPSVEGWQTGVGPDYITSNDPDGYTIGNTFSLSQPCSLLKLWFLSASGVTALPTHCAIWDVATQTEIAGTDVISPSWRNESGGAVTAGGGWVYCDYSGAGIVLPAGRNMIAAAFYPTSGGNTWRGFSIPFWGTGGISGGPAINLGASGLSYGVISAPSTNTGVPLQGGYNGPSNTWGFPSSWNNPENDWTDAEVAPAATSPHSADSAKAVESAFYYISGPADTAHGAEGGAQIRVSGADKAAAADAPLSSWPGAHDAVKAADRAASAWPVSYDTAHGAEGWLPFRFALADTASAADVVHPLGIWTYLPVNVRLLGGRWRVTGLDEHGAEVVVLEAKRLDGELLRLAEQVSFSRVVRRVASGDSARVAEAVAREPVAVTCWVQSAVAVSVTVTPA